VVLSEVVPVVVARAGAVADAAGKAALQAAGGPRFFRSTDPLHKTDSPTHAG